MKTLTKNALLGLAVGGALVMMVSGIFLHNYSTTQGGAILLLAASALRLGIAATED